MDPSRPALIRDEIGELRARVEALETALRLSGIQLPEAERHALPAQTVLGAGEPALAARASVVWEPLPSITAPPPPPPLIAAEAGQGAARSFESAVAGARVDGPAVSRDRSLESRVGAQWFNRIGIVALLIGVSWFLKFAFDNHWVGPLGRIVIGLVAGAGLIGWSERFRHKGFAAFSYSLKAVGSGTLYLSLWAAFSLYHLIPASVAFFAMIAVTAFNGFMAWVQDAELLALYSIVGGLSTPLLVSTGENHEVSLFSYLLLLDVAVLVLVMLRPWSRLLFSAFAGTALYVAGWYETFYSNAQFVRTALFLTGFFLLFAFAPRLIRIDRKAEVKGGWDSLALIVMPVANAVLTFLALYAMLERREAAWAEPWVAVLFAAFYLMLLKLPARGVLRADTALSANLDLTATVVFLALAIPLKTHGRWLTVGWLVEGAALLWVARRTRLPLLRGLALLCLLLGLSALLTINPAVRATPILNERFATYCVAIAAFVFTGLLARSAIEDGHFDTLDTPGSWATLAPASVVLMNLLILIAVSLEIHSYWWYVRWRGNVELMHDTRMYSQFSYSAFFMLFGAVLLTVGFLRHSAFVRWQALVLLAVAIAKVFVSDTSTLSEGYRILSFVGLGALLLGVSFAYQRDWLHLRTPERDAA